MSQDNDVKQSIRKAVSAEVAESLGGSGPTVRSRVVVALTEKKLSERADVLTKAVAKGQELERESNKIRPEDFFALDGTKIVGDRLTAEQNKKRRELGEKIAKLDKAVDTALRDGATQQEWDKLAALAGGKDAKEAEQSAEEQ